MKRLICAIILSSMAYGQGVRFESVATTTTAIGNYPNVQIVLPEATVKVYQYGTTVAATLCTDITCATPALTNIVTADAVGNFGFFAMPGNYSYQVSGTGAVTNMFSVTLGGGLVDPGSNGVLYRNGLNTTRDANYSDIVALWPACTGFLKFDGTCGTGGTGGGGDVSTTPTTSQEIVQPTGTQFCANVVGGIVYVCPSWNWLRTPSGSLTGGVEATITIDPAPLGIDTTNNIAYGGYGLYVAGTGTAEAVAVTGGTCTNLGNVSPCTVIFTPANDHTDGFTLGSASGGIQEAINYSAATGVNNQVVVPPLPGDYTSGYNIYWPITVRFSRGSLTANYATLHCYTRSTCMQLGYLTSATLGPHTISGFRFIPHVIDGGCLITQTSRVAGVNIVNYTGDCSYRVGDLIRVDFTDDPNYWGDHVLSAASAGSVSWLQGTGGVAAQNTPGTIALANDMILDNSAKALMDHIDILQFPSGLCPSNPDGSTRCKFGAFFDFWDDESATISYLTTDGYGAQCWDTYCGSVIYSGGRVGGLYCSGGVCASVIDITHTGITAASNGVTIYNSNGIQISDTIIQGTCMWDLNISNVKGNYLGATVKDMYNESTGCGHVPYWPAEKPANGFHAGTIYGPSTGASVLRVMGRGGPAGSIPTVGTGSTTFDYWIVIHDTTMGTYTAPLLAMRAPNTQTESIQVTWPRVSGGQQAGYSPTDSITYDVIRTTEVGGVFTWPSVGHCDGGGITVCGSVVVGRAQADACTGNGGLVCYFMDDASASTTSYTIGTIDAFVPLIPYWPGDLIVADPTSAIMMDSPPRSITSVRGYMNGPNLYSNTSSGIAGAWISQLADPHSGTSPATVIGNSSTTQGIKGRLLFLQVPSFMPTSSSLITLVDSDLGKTMASATHRPVMDDNDTYIGLDNITALTNTNQARLAFGAPVSISNYIGTKPNGSFAERLTATDKRFTVPVLFDKPIVAFGGATGVSPFVPTGTQFDDNFNRANGSLGANWTDIDGTFAVLSNGATYTSCGADGRAFSLINGTFANDQYVQATYALKATNYDFFGLLVRGAADNVYFVVGGQTSVTLYKKVSGVGSNIGSIASGFGIGDLIRLEAKGDQITVSDNGTTLINVTDTSLASGNPGLAGTCNIPNGPNVDNVRAGDLSWSSQTDILIPTQKATSGTRYLCIDTDGKVVSSASACSGT